MPKWVSTLRTKLNVRFQKQLADLVLQNEELAKKLLEASTDYTTGLLLRPAIYAYLNNIPETEIITVGFADIDHLKYVNTTLGHTAGDRYVAVCSDALRDSMVLGDILVRLGGDEFAFVTSQSPDAFRVHLKESSMGLPRPIGNGIFTSPSVSVGVYSGQRGAGLMSLGCAERALKVAKDTCGGVVDYDPSRDGVPTESDSRPVRRPRDED